MDMSATNNDIISPKVVLLTGASRGIGASILKRLVEKKYYVCGTATSDKSANVISEMIKDYGGIVSVIPKYAVVLMIFTLGGVGIPGTSGFVGEFLILMGAFKKNILVAMIASLGVIIAAAYMLWMYKRVVFGTITKENLKNLSDLNKSEILILVSLAVLTIFFGFYPEPLVNSYEVSVNGLLDKHNLNIQNYSVDLKYD